MICQKCNFQNQLDAKFCVSCGNNLQASEFSPTTSFVNKKQLSVETISEIQTQQNDNKKLTLGSNLFLIIAILLKPFNAYQEEEHKFNNFKQSIFLSVTVAVASTIVTFLTTLLNTIRVHSIYSDEVKWVWENLKEVKYFDVIGKYLLIYFGIIVGIAFVFYIVGLMMKKEVKYQKLLGISAISVIPVLLFTLVVSPIVAFLYAPLGICASLIGGIYTVLLVYELMNQQLKVEGNMKYYFNLICFSIIAITLYFLYMKFMIPSVSNDMTDLKNILDMFN